MLIDHSTGEIIVDPLHSGHTVSTVHEPLPVASSQNTPAKSRIVPGSEYLSLPRAPETFLVAPVLPVGGSMLLYGDPKVGKSFAALQLASALATGQDWLGFRIEHPRKVVYIQLDTPRSLWADRVGALRRAGLATDAIFFADRETLGTWPFDLLDPAHLNMLARELQAIAPDVVILDTLREAHRGDENDATDMQNVVSHLTAAVKPAAIIMIAHGRKASHERGPSLINDNRGSNYVVGAVDAIAHMTAKGVEIGGRAVEEMFLRLERKDDGTWELAEGNKAKALAKTILDDPTNHALSLREKANLLSSQIHKSPAACLSMLQRLSKEAFED